MRAAAYTRISRDATGEALGVQRQEDDCRALCEQRGWTVAEVFTDNDASASSGKPRPAYMRMLKAAEAGDIDIIVSWAMDRLTRSPIEIEHLIKLAEATGVTVATVSGDLDLTTDAGRLVGRILGSVARGEIERKSARQLRANQQRADSGLPPMRRAYGYSTDGMTPLEPEAETVRQLFDRCLTGATLTGMARWLNECGATNTRGDPWHRDAVRNLLMNPRYKGTRVYRGAEVGPGRWMPLVSEETWLAAHTRLTDTGRVTNHVGTARKWLGSRLYLCGRCPDGDRSTMSVNYRAGARMYRCRKYLHMARIAEPVDDMVAAVIVARLRRSDLADLLAAPATATGPSVTALRRTAEGLRQRRDGLGVELADGVLTARQVQIATRKLQSKLDAIEGQLAAAGQRTALDAMLTNPDPGLAWLDADLQQQRGVIDALCEVVLLPSGRRPFDPASVQILWRT